MVMSKSNSPAQVCPCEFCAAPFWRTKSEGDEELTLVSSGRHEKGEYVRVGSGGFGVKSREWCAVSCERCMLSVLYCSVL